MQVGVAQVVERPTSRNDHRVGVTTAEHAPAGVVAGEHVEPEDEILGAHPVGDRRRIGTAGTLAQPVHR